MSFHATAVIPRLSLHWKRKKPRWKVRYRYSKKVTVDSFKGSISCRIAPVMLWLKQEFLLAINSQPVRIWSMSDKWDAIYAPVKYIQHVNAINHWFILNSELVSRTRIKPVIFTTKTASALLAQIQPFLTFWVIGPELTVLQSSIEKLYALCVFD